MVLADPDHPPAPRVHHAVGIAQSSRPRRVSGDCNGRLSRLLAIKALVCIVAEINDAVADEVRPAAILMDAGPHVEDRFACQRWRNIGRGAIGGAADDYRAPILLRARLEPIDIGAVELDAAKPDRRGDDQVGGDRRGPRTVRRCMSFGHRNLSQPSRRPATVVSAPCFRTGSSVPACRQNANGEPGAPGSPQRRKEHACNALSPGAPVSPLAASCSARRRHGEPGLGAACRGP